MATALHRVERGLSICYRGYVRRSSISPIGSIHKQDALGCTTLFEMNLDGPTSM